jgi:hypothetical protein
MSDGLEELEKRLQAIKNDMNELSRITNLLNRQSELLETFDTINHVIKETDKLDSAYETTSKQLKNMVDTYGIEVYNNTTLLKALTSDYITFDTSIRELLCRAIDKNIPKKLYAIKDISDDDKKQRLKEIEASYVQQNAADGYAANFVVDCFNYAMGTKNS